MIRFQITDSRIYATSQTLTRDLPEFPRKLGVACLAALPRQRGPLLGWNNRLRRRVHRRARIEVGAEVASEDLLPRPSRLGSIEMAMKRRACGLAELV